MTRQIALLRGINVGRSRRVPMPALRELLTGLGYGDVRTHLQSGNVILTADVSGEELERALEREIAASLGVDVPVVVRTRDELADVVARNPLAGVADDPARYLVSFLSREPEPRLLEELAALDLAPEAFVVNGREIYAWHPGGVHASPLARLLSGERLGVEATARNWNTVTRLLALVDEPA
jgi:uncharacterized protein (DUF1697 family)